MSRLFKLREWLSLEESAAHISNVLGEPATITDLYRFALDGHLRISVDFVNSTMAKKGKWLDIDQIENTLDDPNLYLIKGKKREKPLSDDNNHEKLFLEYDWIALRKSVGFIKGVWDLAMIGGEVLDLEHAFQRLTSGLEVTGVSIDGTYVQNGRDICQLQTDYDDNEFQSGSQAERRGIERYIKLHDVGEDKAKEIRATHEKERQEFLKERKKRPEAEKYFPSGGLSDHEYVFVIRTQEITRFIQSLENSPTIEKPLTSNERNSLLVLIGAMCKNVGIDPEQRGVAASLVKMTEISGAPLTDDTIRKILKQIEEAISARSK